MIKLFKIIRQKNINEVRQLIEAKPELVNCVAGKSLKKDAGESPLQTAIKTEQFEIANLLIENGADLSYMESPEGFEWSKPVLHYAISAAVLNSRFGIYIPKYSKQNTTGFLGFFKKNQWKTQNKPRENYQKAFNLLETIIKSGAKVNCFDSYGCSSAERFCAHLHHDVILDKSKTLHQESLDDLMPILEVLGITQKSDFDISSINGDKSKTVYYFYKHFIDQLIK